MRNKIQILYVSLAIGLAIVVGGCSKRPSNGEIFNLIQNAGYQGAILENFNYDLIGFSEKNLEATVRFSANLRLKEVRYMEFTIPGEQFGGHVKEVVALPICIPQQTIQVTGDVKIRKYGDAWLVVERLKGMGLPGLRRDDFAPRTPVAAVSDTKMIFQGKVVWCTTSAIEEAIHKYHTDYHGKIYPTPTPKPTPKPTPAIPRSLGELRKAAIIAFNESEMLPISKNEFWILAKFLNEKRIQVNEPNDALVEADAMRRDFIRTAPLYSGKYAVTSAVPLSKCDAALFANWIAEGGVPASNTSPIIPLP